jgi:MFS family permease
VIPIVSALTEGGFVGVIADKVYRVHPGLLALIVAAPMLGQLASVAFARIAAGRRKVPLVTSLMAVSVLGTASIALLPERPLAGSLLAGLMILTRLALSGIITIRSVVWTLNYPRESRARVTSRLQILTALTMTATSVAGGLFLDSSPESFRSVYLVGAALAAFGVLFFSRVKLVDEPAQLARERGAGFTEAGAAPRLSGGAFELLREDRTFARYQMWQFLLGVSNMMVEAPLVFLVSRELEAGYAASIALTQAIPLGLSLVTLPVWAGYMDRVHILQFRAYHSWLWVISQALTWLGAIQGSLLWVTVGRIVLGFGRGGGSLAWQLGHNDFAKPENVGLYMGVHVTLTGIRGAFAPFLGMLLYVGWSPIELPLLGLRLPEFPGIGGHAIGLACLFSAAATLGYGRLHREVAGELTS